MILGYKCFKKGLINRYGMKFEVGQKYTKSGEIKFGNNGNGYHFCKNLEDTLRYFDSFSEQLDICEVIGDGKINIYNDEYYGYYDMYVCSNLEIIKILNENEILEYILNAQEDRIIRFINTYKLNEEQIYLLKQKYIKNQEILNALIYQYEDKQIYEKCKKIKKF